MDAPLDPAQTLVGGQTGYAVPLMVAVTGHRDLVPDEVPGIRAHVRAFLERLVTRCPERPVTVMSSLAAGADQLVVLTGMLLLAVGVRQSYAFSVADFELIKQYEFMYRAFGKAHDRIRKCPTDDDRRGVLRLLGQAALEEHAEWILMHRERSISEGEIWRMTG